MSDKLVKKYFENMPYGDDAKPSEIHGKENQNIINEFVTSLVRNYDVAMQQGDKIKANKFYGAVTDMHGQLENLKSIKEEFAMNYGGGVGGKNLYSNYTDLSWDRKFWTEQGKINFDAQMKPVLVVEDAGGNPIVKRIEDITENWVVKGDAENSYMKMQQDAVKQKNTMGNPIDFDVDWAVSNLLTDNDNWKSFASDKVGGRYFLQDYLTENQEAYNNGQIPDEMLRPESFNPEVDGRLHKYYSDRLKRSFDSKYGMEKQNVQAPKPENNKQNIDQSMENVKNFVQSMDASKKSR